MRYRVLGALIALALPASMAAPQVIHSQSKGSDLNAIDAAVEAMQRNDCRAAMKLVEPMLQPKAVVRLPEPIAVMSYYIAAICRSEAGDNDGARRAAVAGTAFESASDELWHVRIGVELDSKDHQAPLVTIAAMMQRRPGALNSVPIRWFYQFDREIRDANETDVRLQFLRLMNDNGYDPAELSASKDTFRRDLANMLDSRGDKSGAMALIREIRSTSMLMELSLDPRFRTMLSGFDPRAAEELQLSRAREILVSHPNALWPIINVSEHLRTLGRFKESLAVLETARTNGRKLLDYTDAKDQARWWWDGLAYTYSHLGDAEASFAAFRSGIEAGEADGPKVSQRINLAGSQNRFARWSDALATLAPFDGKMPVSAYGDMQMRTTRGCASARLGKTAAYVADRAFAETHEKDAVGALRYLLICAGEMDAAAALTIRELDDPERRSKTLIALADYDPPAAGEPQSPFEGKYDELTQRPDVRAAIDRAGGLPRIHLPPGAL